MPFDLKRGLAEARKVMTVDVSDENEAACLEFIQDAAGDASGYGL